ncbi:MAG TPA: flavin reductase family protein [Dehalococcoidia bacterium]|nr:flavin reductase family protein [Dehalococcoidia bacterium]
MKIDPGSLSERQRHLFMGNLVVPRPIALVSTISPEGIPNLAPYSLFNIVCYHPVPIVFYTPMRKAGGQKKDSLVNVELTSEFVINLVTEEIAEKMNITSGNYPPEVDEFTVSHLTPVPADLVKASLVKESPFNLECRLYKIVPFGSPDIAGDMIMGEVLRVHVKDELWNDGIIDANHAHLIGRMGWGLYTRTHDLFEIGHPSD